MLLSCCVPAIPALAQPEVKPVDPEYERRWGIWLDEAISVGLAPNRSLEFEFHQRFDEGGTNLFEYFNQVGPGFRLRPWLLVIPIYRYQRYPSNPETPFEHRLLLNVTPSITRGRWQFILRTLTEGRFPASRIASARIRLRPGIEYTLPLRKTRSPVVVINNEFFVVIGQNSFAGTSSFTQNRFQAGVRQPITESFSIRLYYLRQWVNPPRGWDSNGVLGLSFAFRF